MNSAMTEKIIELDRTLKQTLTIGFSPVKDTRSDAIRSFCDELVDLSTRIQLKIDPDEDGILPAILVGSGLRYQAAPTGSELEPFFEALRMVNQPAPPEIVQAVRPVAIPVDIKIFVAPQCSFCPGVVKQMLPLPFANQNIRLTVIDSFLFSELSEKWNVKSVPTVILDGRFRWTGSVPRTELIEAMIQRDPAALGAPILERMILEGNAFQLAEMMMTAEKIFPAFIDLLVSDQFSIRLGAMAAMEQIADSAPAVGEQIIETLNDRFTELSDQIKGDVLYVFGELKSPKALAFIKQVIDGDYDPEVIEAAEDALENYHH